MKQERKEKNKRHRKVLLLLPLILLPLSATLFMLLGGGSTSETVRKREGFNLILPTSGEEQKELQNKLRYYERAEAEEAKTEEWRKKDPNYRFAQAEESTGDSPDSDYRDDGEQKGLQLLHNPNEQKVYKKLEALQKVLEQPNYSTQQHRIAPAFKEEYDGRRELEQMQALMTSMEKAPERDPEMEQINGMLETILDIQYPERMEEKLRKASRQSRGTVFSVSVPPQQSKVGCLSNNIIRAYNATERSTNGTNRFYSLEGSKTTDNYPNAITASIAEAQTLVSGATVKLRLDQQVYLNGSTIEPNTFIYGLAGLKGERLMISVTGIRSGNSIYPVELEAYDLDGLKGIYIPGAITRDVAKNSVERSSQNIGLTTLSDSWSAQAAGAGIEAAKGLVRKKAKQVKVSLKAGYQILLIDEKQQDEPIIR